MGVAGDSNTLEGWLQGTDASRLLIALLPVWILGALIGMLVCGWIPARRDIITWAPSPPVLHSSRVFAFSTHTSQSVLQLPRPRWLETSTRVGAYWLSSPSGVLLRRFALALQGFVIARYVS